MKSCTKIKALEAIPLVITFTLLSACGGEFSYKRGAGVDELEDQKSLCKKQSLTEEALGECLRENGWVVVDLDNDAPLLGHSLKSRKILNPISTSYKKASNDPFADSTEAALTDESTEVTAEVEPQNPTDMIKVNSWWKAGAGADELKRDGADCLQTLSEPHSANENYSEVTLGLAYCMQDKGWRVLLAQ